MLRKLTAAIALSSGVLGSSFAYGLGLGDATLDSSLNQKLNADIQLTDVGQLSAIEILPSLATSADFKRAGVQRPAFLSKLRFDVVTGADNKPYIRVTSKEPVTEPFLNFLLEVHWPQGRLLKEYTLLLDPPSFSSEVAAAPEPQPIAKAQPKPKPQPKPSAQSSSKPKQIPNRLGSSTPPADTSAEITSKRPSDTYRVRKEDTLSQIAMKTRPPGVSLNRMMLALQAENPTAFINGNINLLKPGVTLTIPDQSMLRSIDEATARNAIVTQDQEWRSGGKKVQIDATPRDTAPAPVQQIEDGRLDIVAGGKAGQGQGGDESATGELESALAANQEELDALGRQNTELKERLQELEEQISTLEKLVVLRNDQLAAAQKLADKSLADLATGNQAQTNQAEAAKPVTKPKSKPEPTFTEPPTIEGVASAVADAGEAESNVPAGDGISVQVDYNFNNGSPAPHSEPVKRPAPVAPELNVDEIFRLPVNEGIGLIPIIGGSAVALLTLLGGLLLLRRRKEPEDIDERYEDEGDDDPISKQDLSQSVSPTPAPSDVVNFASDVDLSEASGKADIASQSPLGFDYNDDVMPDFNEPDHKEGTLQPNKGPEGSEFELNDNANNLADLDLDLDALEAELDSDSFSKATPAPDASTPASTSKPPVQSDHTDHDDEENWDDDLSLDDLDAELMKLNNSAPDRPAPPATDNGPDLVQDDSVDEIGTMLDLARAYVDMDDKEGARDILEEIVAEGSAAQQAQAQQLLNKLG